MSVRTTPPSDIGALYGDFRAAAFGSRLIPVKRPGLRLPEDVPFDRREAAL